MTNHDFFAMDALRTAIDALDDAELSEALKNQNTRDVIYHLRNVTDARIKNDPDDETRRKIRAAWYLTRLWVDDGLFEALALVETLRARPTASETTRSHLTRAARHLRNGEVFDAATAVREIRPREADGQPVIDDLDNHLARRLKYLLNTLPPTVFPPRETNC